MRSRISHSVIAFTMALILVLSIVATALAYDTIPYGEQSDNVRKMQNALKAKGCYSGAIDGSFGPSTRRAVIKYQKRLGITADGKPGNKTLKALYDGGSSAINKVTQKDLINADAPKNPRSLYYGCTGSRVKSLQKALKAAGCYNGSADGVYGDLTYAAVKKFQYKKGIRADGVAGTKTLALLNKDTKSKVGGGFVLSMGSKGATTKKFQVYLRDKGYSLGEDELGYYNKGTKAAVEKWQADTGKAVTGTVSEGQYNGAVLAPKVTPVP
ncbi:MAG: peptidoglycan-binding protein [Clostridia bacterium]